MDAADTPIYTLLLPWKLVALPSTEGRLQEKTNPSKRQRQRTCTQEDMGGLDEARCVNLTESNQITAVT